MFRLISLWLVLFDSLNDDASLRMWHTSLLKGPVNESGIVSSTTTASFFLGIIIGFSLPFWLIRPDRVSRMLLTASKLRLNRASRKSSGSPEKNNRSGSRLKNFGDQDRLVDASLVREVLLLEFGRDWRQSLHCIYDTSSCNTHLLPLQKLSTPSTIHALARSYSIIILTVIIAWSTFITVRLVIRGIVLIPVI